MKIRALFILVIFVAVIAASQTALAQNPPTVAIDRGGVNDLVYLSTMDAAAQHNFARIWEVPRYLDYQPYALLMTNASGQSIVAVTVRWTGTASGVPGVYQYDSSTDSLKILLMGAGGSSMSLPVPGRGRTMEGHGSSWASAEGQVVAANGERMLVTPGMFVKEDVTRQRTTVGASSGLDTKLKSADTVTAGIDVVILEDGRVLGADQSRTVDRLRASKAAIDSLLNAVKTAEQNGQDGLEVVRKIADINRPVDPATAGQARLARMLMSSRQWRDGLEKMAAIPLPNFHR